MRVLESVRATYRRMTDRAGKHARLLRWMVVPLLVLAMIMRLVTLTAPGAATGIAAAIVFVITALWLGAVLFTSLLQHMIKGWATALVNSTAGKYSRAKRWSLLVLLVFAAALLTWTVVSLALAMIINWGFFFG